MSKAPNIKQLDAVVRVLSNVDHFLKSGMFLGQNSNALAEAQVYIASLLKQTQEQLQSILNEKLKDEEPKEEENAVSKG